VDVSVITCPIDDERIRSDPIGSLKVSEALRTDSIYQTANAESRSHDEDTGGFTVIASVVDNTWGWAMNAKPMLISYWSCVCNYESGSHPSVHM
jgi:hypothetical protein